MNRSHALLCALVISVSALCITGVTGCVPSTRPSTTAGTTATVELPANDTTGYSWSYTMSEDGVLTEQSSEYVPDANPDGRTGVGGTQRYVFAAGDDGTVTISFVYAQSWSGGATSDNSASYTYTVNSGRVTLESSNQNLDGLK